MYVHNLTEIPSFQKLYRLGARKMVLVGIGPLGCIPSQLSMASSNNGCVEQVNSLVTLFNNGLIQLIRTFNTSHPGSIFVYQNIYSIFSNMVTDPSKYGQYQPQFYRTIKYGLR